VTESDTRQAKLADVHASASAAISLPNVKPILRGYLHLFAAVAAVAGTALLLVRSDADRAKQLSLLVYGIAMVWLFGVSALYHIPRWPAGRRALLRRLDHANIFVMIAGTYTPLVFNLMEGIWRVSLLAAVWILALLGVVAENMLGVARRWLTAALYVAVGWVAIIALPQLLAVIGVRGLALIGVGGLLYSLGALTYASRRPRLWPRVFGYHELFHLLVVAANGVFFVTVLNFVLPRHT
jgi:hemolysin III